MLTIENAQLRVEIDEKGAQLSHVINKMGNFDYIWNGSEWPYHAPIQFPAIGKSTDNKYSLNGRTYGMKENGFVSDYEWTVVDKGDERVSLTITENEETLKSYPFEFSLMVTYSLEANALHTKFLLKNNSQAKMPFSLGFAPAFNLPMIPDVTELVFSDYHLSFMPEVQILSQLKLDENKFRTGEESPVDNSKNGQLPLNYDEFSAGPIIISTPGLTEVKLNGENSNHFISLTLEDFPQIAVSTMAKEKAKFICLEPINGLPDLDNQELTDWNTSKNKQLIEPDSSLELGTVINFK